MSGITLESMKASGLVAPDVVSEILEKAVQDSAVQKLARKVPLSLAGSNLIVQTTSPEAGVVGEGQAKPVTSIGLGGKVLKPIKVAAIVRWSEETAQKNPGRVIELIQEQLAGAITRAFDLAVLHGKSTSGVAIPGVEYVNQTTNRVELGSTPANKGGLSIDLLNGAALVEEADPSYTVNGIAASAGLRSKLLRAVDSSGRPLYASGMSLATSTGDILGLPAVVTPAVSGKIGANPDAKTRAFAGDWSKLVYGFAQDINFKFSNEATLTDGSETVNLWQTNQEAALCEATFGWAIADPKAFVAYEDKVADAA